MKDEIKIKKSKVENKTETAEISNTEEEKKPAADNSFWKKLGSAVKKAVDCCLEG